MRLPVQRRFTRAGKSPYAAISFRLASSEIRKPDGSIVFRLDQVEVPAAWSQVAIDVLAQKYFRKAGVPARLKPVPEKGVPAWLCRRVADERRWPSCPRTSVTAARPAPRRCSTASPERWTYWGWKGGYFAARGRCARVLRRACATCWRRRWRRRTRRSGSTPACTGPTASTARRRATSTSTRRPARSRPRPRPTSGRSPTPASSRASRTISSTRAASWICGSREARLFKYGSGTGTNFSSLRAEDEPLSGGGKSSGLMSFLKIGDRAAGAIKSGGTTRRAAKMVIVDVDHPDIEEFIDWKVVEEQKVAALVAGSQVCSSGTPTRSWRPATTRPRPGRPLRPGREPGAAQGGARGAPGAAARGAIQQVILYASQGYTAIEIPTYDTDWDSDAYLTVSGQNSNNIGPRHRRVHARRCCEDARLAAGPPHRRQGRQDAARPASCGTRSASPPGPAPIPACSTTPPSTTGTPARRRGGSTRRTPARSTCSSTTRPAIWRR